MSDPKVILEATLTLVLAGGQGERLRPLTARRPKPFIPIGGLFRLVDFSLSNCFNSGLRRLFLLTQYKYESLHRYIRDGWSSIWNRRQGDTSEYIICLPPVSGKRYRGTADAVYQNLEIIGRENPEYLLVVSTDRIYRMDYSELLLRHVSSGAAVTVAEVRRPTKRGRRAANMGVYVFTTSALVRAVTEDAQQVTNHDLEADIIPLLIKSCPVSAFPFHRYCGDIQTIDSYYEANMELAQAQPPFDPYTNAVWPIWTPGLGVLHSAEMVLLHEKGIRNSIISPGVRIAAGAEVDSSIIMKGAIVGEGARIRRAIVEEGVEIPPGSQIGFDRAQDRARYPISGNGIVVVAAEAN